MNFRSTVHVAKNVCMHTVARTHKMAPQIIPCSRCIIIKSESRCGSPQVTKVSGYFSKDVFLSCGSLSISILFHAHCIMVLNTETELRIAEPIVPCGAADCLAVVPIVPCTGADCALAWCRKCRSGTLGRRKDACTTINIATEMWSVALSAAECIHCNALFGHLGNSICSFATQRSRHVISHCTAHFATRAPQSVST